MGGNITLPMFLRAVTLGNKTVSRKVTINFNRKWTNTAPKIDDVKKFLKVSVKEEDIENGLAEKFVSYVSKKAYDKEGDKPIISVKGADLPCKCATFVQQRDNSFKLEMDKSKLTKKDAGAHAIYISVKDEYSKLFFTKNMYVITLIIDYEEKIVIEESVAYQEEVKAKVIAVAEEK
jgi:hypothetical protein